VALSNPSLGSSRDFDLFFKLVTSPSLLRLLNSASFLYSFVRPSNTRLSHQNFTFASNHDKRPLWDVAGPLKTLATSPSSTPVQIELKINQISCTEVLPAATITISATVEGVSVIIKKMALTESGSSWEFESAIPLTRRVASGFSFGVVKGTEVTSTQPSAQRGVSPSGEGAPFITRHDVPESDNKQPFAFTPAKAPTMNLSRNVPGAAPPRSKHKDGESYRIMLYFRLY
jgi:hypothetical protein